MWWGHPSQAPGLLHVVRWGNDKGVTPWTRPLGLLCWELTEDHQGLKQETSSGVTEIAQPETWWLGQVVRVLVVAWVPFWLCFGCRDCRLRWPSLCHTSSCTKARLLPNVWAISGWKAAYGDLLRVANIHWLRRRYLIGGKPLFLKFIYSHENDLLSSNLYFLMMLRHAGGQNLYKCFKGAREC